MVLVSSDSSMWRVISQMPSALTISDFSSNVLRASHHCFCRRLSLELVAGDFKMAKKNILRLARMTVGAYNGNGRKGGT